VLAALSKGRDLHTLGLHEYLPEPGRIGRFKAMIERCTMLGIQPPRMVVTEFGWDSDGGSQNGYKSRGIDGADYAMKLIDLVETVYRPYVDDGTLLGLNVFSYGNSGSWANYDVENDVGFWDTISGWHYEPTPIPKPEPAPAPVVPPPTITTNYAEVVKALRALADALEAWGTAG
jgi:hypothetical protein